MSRGDAAAPGSGLWRGRAGWVEWHRAVALEGGGGMAGGLARAMLAGASLAFGAAVRARAAMYDRGVLGARHPGVPVIAVGNVTTGGTGKSPLVRWIAARLTAAGVAPGVVARGYRARAGELGDELRELLRALPGVTVVQDADRVRGAATAIARGARALVLDDAFQHRRIARDLDIAVVSARDPWGGGWLLPRGLLREPPRALTRAHHIVVTRADQVDKATLRGLEAQLAVLAPGVTVTLSRHVPVAVRLAGTEAVEAPAWLAGRAVWALSAIGDPGAFERTLAACGATVVGATRFPDHHAYVTAELEAVATRARAAGASAIATTAKDAARLPSAPWAPPIAALEIALELEDPRALDAAIAAVIGSGG